MKDENVASTSVALSSSLSTSLNGEFLLRERDASLIRGDEKQSKHAHDRLT
jgi:hypothetical protein